jgi:hypothetical protein
MTDHSEHIIIYAYQEFISGEPGLIKQGISRVSMASRISKSIEHDRKTPGRENVEYRPLGEFFIDGTWADANALEAHMLHMMGMTLVPVAAAEPRIHPSEWFRPDAAFDAWASRVNTLLVAPHDCWPDLSEAAFRVWFRKAWPELGPKRIRPRTRWEPYPKYPEEQRDHYFGWAWEPKIEGWDVPDSDIQIARKECFAVAFRKVSYRS